MKRQYQQRLMIIISILVLAGLLVIGQIMRIQNSAEAKLFREQGQRYATEFRTFYPERGSIYDRNGNLLAGNKTVYAFGVQLSDMKDKDAIATAVAAALGKSPEEIVAALASPAEGQQFVVLGDYVDAAAARPLLGMLESTDPTLAATASRLRGLVLTPHPQRDYPEGSLAADILGFVSREGKGYYGVEEKYNSLLAGSPVQAWVPVDPSRAVEIPRVPPGTTLVLSLDRELQAASERILDENIKKYGAVSGTIVVMDPRDGGILALASTPRMNLNEFWTYGTVYKNATEFNPAISKPYEPGSVMKVLTMASALDTSAVQPHTPFLDTGAIMVGGATIMNWDQQAWGQQDMIGCMQHSLNVCLAWVAQQVGADNFYKYMIRFGFGHLTGVDLAAEASGRLKLPGDGDWYPVDLATNAFGQGITATPMQMLMATSAVANNGKMVVPHVLSAMVRDGHQYDVPAQFAGSPITPETAQTLSGMLAQSLEQESSNALVPGYRVAGKTGTAQIPGPGGYEDGATNASFVGWGPVGNPQFMIYVWLERPAASIWGSTTAAPTFSEMAKQTVLLMNIPPDDVRQQLARP